MVLPKPAMKTRGTATKAMKAMKVMKAKRVSKVARGRFAKALVFRGAREKTVGGVKAEGLMKNKRGKIVSKRQSAAGKRRYRQISDWTEAVMEARHALHSKGFVAINGKTLHGKALYVKARSIREERRRGSASSASSPARVLQAASPARAAAQTPQASA
mmetsp:Transcript_39042/g.87934  ORF Transcript_39042/g.87934 Transcript_39042/m.87934 type:complete len:159 (-) Transcript_39042:167-643(-)